MIQKVLQRFQKHQYYGRNQLLSMGAFHSGTGNISMALSSKQHENQWDCILTDPRHLIMYDAGDLGKHAFSRVMMDKENDERTEIETKQIMTFLSCQVESIAITQGTIDWKYGRRLTFTSAISSDIIKPCVSNAT